MHWNLPCFGGKASLVGFSTMQGKRLLQQEGSSEAGVAVGVTDSTLAHVGSGSGDAGAVASQAPAYNTRSQGQVNASAPTRPTRKRCAR